MVCIASQRGAFASTSFSNLRKVSEKIKESFSISTHDAAKHKVFPRERNFPNRYRNILINDIKFHGMKKKKNLLIFSPFVCFVIARKENAHLL